MWCLCHHQCQLTWVELKLYVMLDDLAHKRCFLHNCVNILPIWCFDNNCSHCNFFQNANVLDEAVQQLNDKQCTQPVLFKFSDRFWVKTDNSAIAVPNVSCVADAFDFLFRFFWVVNVEYPHELRLVFGFFEKLLWSQLLARASP